MKQISGADLFVKALKEEAVDTLFAYPGGQALPLQIMTVFRWYVLRDGCQRTLLEMMPFRK